MQSPYAANSDTFYAGCDKTKTSVIKVDEVSDVLEEAAPKVRVEWTIRNITTESDKCIFPLH